MAKDKKGKSEGKKAKAAEKKLKAEKKGLKKSQSKKSKDVDSDAEDIDLDAVLAEIALKQEQFLKVTETPCAIPPPRASATFIANPDNRNELFLFGGEFFNGATATNMNDFYVYLIDRDEWRMVTSPNSPLPRSGHAWCRGGNAGGVYLFGGEFSSPKQGTFYHYNDFWRFDPGSREWTRIESKKGPPARSGHRMTYYKKYIILFGGFQDTSQQTKYLGDLWIYDTQNFVWHNPVLPIAMQKPDPRSSFSFLPHEQGAALYGGYSRVKATVTGKQVKGSAGPSQRNILKPLVHQDCWFLRITPPPPDAPSNTPPSVRWERRKRPVNAPNPPRAGSTMVYHQGRGITFGGVHDVEQDEEGIDSEFFNTLFAWNMERNRFFEMKLRKPRSTKQKPAIESRGGGRRGRGQANEEELLRNLAALETGRSIADADLMELDKPIDADEEKEREQKVEKKVAMEFPHPRFNAQLAVQDDVLYIYGGTFEKGDREFTFDEMYAVDLGRMDGVKEIFSREPENWLGSDDEESEEDDDEEEESDEESDEEEPQEAPVLYTESKRKGKKGKEAVAAMDDAASEASSEAPSSVFDDLPDDASEMTAPDDNLPQPRPFETRRDFFQRTSNEWQNLLMEGLRWKGIQPETLSIKEIKTRAFEMSAEKWWDVREQIIALEEEQEAAGIGEVVSLADKAESGGGGPRRR